jgi:hypothetical protein
MMAGIGSPGLFLICGTSGGVVFFRAADPATPFVCLVGRLESEQAVDVFTSLEMLFDVSIGHVRGLDYYYFAIAQGGWQSLVFILLFIY